MVSKVRISTRTHRVSSSSLAVTVTPVPTVALVWDTASGEVVTGGMVVVVASAVVIGWEVISVSTPSLAAVVVDTSTAGGEVAVGTSATGAVDVTTASSGTTAADVSPKRRVLGTSAAEVVTASVVEVVVAGSSRLVAGSVTAVAGLSTVVAVSATGTDCALVTAGDASAVSGTAG